MGATPLSYDANANLAGDGTHTYVHNALGQLVSVTTPSGPVQYAYDALGRRTHRTAGGETTVTVYDGLRPIEAYDAGGAWQHTLPYGPGLDEPLGFWNSAGHYN